MNSLHDQWKQLTIEPLVCNISPTADSVMNALDETTFYHVMGLAKSLAASVFYYLGKFEKFVEILFFSTYPGPVVDSDIFMILDYVKIRNNYCKNALSLDSFPQF